MTRTHVPVGWIIAAALFPATVFAQTSKPTFGKDIAPIVYAKCAMCHRPGEVAPMSLMSYDEVRPWARAIKNKVVARQMPPWYAEGEHGKWRNDRRLSQAEIDKIVAWVDAGAPRGNDSELPAPPQLAQGWNGPSGTPPDLIIEAPEMKVPAEGESPWQYAYVKLPFQGDVWVAASQVVPGNRAAVHHVLVTAVTLPPNAQVDAEGRMKLQQGASVDPAGRVSTARAAPHRRAARWSAAAALEGSPVAGSPGLMQPSLTGRAWRSISSARISCSTCTTRRTDRRPRTRPASASGSQRVPITHASQGPGGGGFGNETFIVNGKELTGRFSAQVTQDILPPGLKTVPNIPAGADNYRLTNLLPIRQETVLYSIQPHMHLRGKSMKYTAVYPDGREEELLNVPALRLQLANRLRVRKASHAACGNHGSRRSGVGQLDQEQATTRGRTRRSSGASRAGTRCSARSSAAWCS